MRTLRALVCALLSSGVFFVTCAKAQTTDLSLQDLFDGATITAVDKYFSNWKLDLFELQGDAYGSPAGIFVTPIEDDPLDPGLKFNIPNGMGTEFSNAGNSYVLLDFSFDVQTTSGQALIKDNSLLLSGFTIDAGPTGLINIRETISDASGASLGGKFVQATVADKPGSGAPNLFDSAEFAPQSSVHIQKMIEILGPNMDDGVVLRMFEQRFSQVPEPSALALAISAMLVLCVWKRRP